MNPLQQLDLRIKTSLQDYLGTPIEARTYPQYCALVDDLNRAAMDYAQSVVSERLNARRQEQKYQQAKWKN